MSPLVEIVGVSAHAPHSKAGPARWVGKGSRVDVDQETADRWAADGVAVQVGKDVAAEQAVTTDPASTAPASAVLPVNGPLPADVESRSVAGLKGLVKERGLTVGQARTKPALLELLRGSVAASDGDTSPPVDLDVPLGDDDAELPEGEVDLSALTDGQLRKLAAEEDVELPEGVTRGRAIELIGAADEDGDDEDGDPDGDA